jgi:hypothetical protein
VDLNTCNSDDLYRSWEHSNLRREYSQVVVIVVIEFEDVRRSFSTRIVRYKYQYRHQQRNEAEGSQAEEWFGNFELYCAFYQTSGEHIGHMD